MILSDVSVKRPVFAAVISLLLIVFGLVSFGRLPLREYPDIDPPVVTIETLYPGASANVVETRITELIEERIAGVEGIQFIASTSEDGLSAVTIEFDTGRDVDGAVNDVRDRVSAILGDLPDEADPPEIQKVDSNNDVIMWLNLVSHRMTVPALTDFADRYLVDRFSVLDGVARVRIGGGQNYAMRIWIDRRAMAARGLVVGDVEDALRAENLELPAGSIESRARSFTVRVKRTFRTAQDFSRLVLARGTMATWSAWVTSPASNAVPKRTGRSFEAMAWPWWAWVLSNNRLPIRSMWPAAPKRKMLRLNPHTSRGDGNQAKLRHIRICRRCHQGSLQDPADCHRPGHWCDLSVSGQHSATIVPAVTVPVSIIASFIVLNMLGFSVNLLTLLALVLAIGLVVDDAIVVLENVYRRMAEKGESPLVAAYTGARQVGFAVIATSVVLVAVFVPIAFLQGDVGRLFSEFAITMAAAVCFSSIVALSLSPMLASKILRRKTGQPGKHRLIDRLFGTLRKRYRRSLGRTMKRPWLVMGLLGVLVASVVWLFGQIPTEYAPKEDRGAFLLSSTGRKAPPMPTWRSI
jgi:multidrug efflux pump